MTERVQRAWEAVLSTENGRIVLASMLANTSLFRASQSPDEVAVDNWFKTLLGEVGIYTEDPRFHLDFVKALLPYEQRSSNE